MWGDVKLENSQKQPGLTCIPARLCPVGVIYSTLITVALRVS